MILIISWIDKIKTKITFSVTVTEEEHTKNSTWEVESSDYTHYPQRIPHLQLEHAHLNLG